MYHFGEQKSQLITKTLMLSPDARATQSLEICIYELLTLSQLIYARYFGVRARIPVYFTCENVTQ